MFFTREDINKIYQALLKLGIKDSELPETSDVKNDDTLAIVQDGKNKQINVREFLNQISLWKREDFINVTDKYKKSHITLVEAIQAIPIVQRKEGLVITFLDTENNWRIYQFRGSLLQFNNETLWVDLYDFSPYIIDSILPDEEDITQSAIDKQGNTYLSLKDREYNPSEFSGKGYKILRKNIIEIEDENFNKVKKNILTKEMINEPNTIYEIRYDFDLNGAEITIPENCVLKFNGGKLSNGTIIGQNTRIEANLLHIFDDVSFAGIFEISSIFPEWFGAVGDDTTDDSIAFKKCVELAVYSTSKRISLASKTYRITQTNVIKWTSILQGLSFDGVSFRSSVMHLDASTGSFYATDGAERAQRYNFNNITFLSESADACFTITSKGNDKQFRFFRCLFKADIAFESHGTANGDLNKFIDCGFQGKTFIVLDNYQSVANACVACNFNASESVVKFINGGHIDFTCCSVDFYSNSGAVFDASEATGASFVNAFGLRVELQGAACSLFRGRAGQNVGLNLVCLEFVQSISTAEIITAYYSNRVNISDSRFNIRVTASITGSASYADAGTITFTKCRFYDLDYYKYFTINGTYGQFKCVDCTCYRGFGKDHIYPSDINMGLRAGQSVSSSAPIKAIVFKAVGNKFPLPNETWNVDLNLPECFILGMMVTHPALGPTWDKDYGVILQRNNNSTVCESSLASLNTAVGEFIPVYKEFGGAFYKLKGKGDSSLTTITNTSGEVVIFYI